MPEPWLTFDGALPHQPAIDAWFLAQPAALGAIARDWFARMRACGDDVTELLHDGHPTACVGDAAFGYVNVFTAHVNVGFFHGADLDDPAHLLEGTGRRMRHVKLRSGSEVDAAALSELMSSKERLEHEYSKLRVELMRHEAGYGHGTPSPEELRAAMHRVRGELNELDERIAPLAQEAGSLQNERWGLLMRAGIDKSYFARQVERYADVYTSRVSNLLELTPFVYLRAPRVSLPHDAGLDAST